MDAAPDLAKATWDDLTAEQRPETKTPIELADPAQLDEGRRYWLENGVYGVGGVIAPEVIDAYCAEREKLPRDRKAKDNYWDGWHYPTPYQTSKALRDIALSPALMGLMSDLIGSPVALHLCLTGWVSTERKFHQDSYLNPSSLGSNYIACWIALDDISADSGPFEFVRGSNRWPVLQQDRLFSKIPESWRTSPHWPTWSQNDVGRVCEEEIAKREAKVERFLPKRGDVLIWHSNLVHRGSAPTNRFAMRKALICHYSSIAHRFDMGSILRHDNGMLFFNLLTNGSVRP